MAMQCRKKAVYWKSVTAVKQGRLIAAKVSLEQLAGNIQEIKDLLPTPNSINSHARDSGNREDKYKDTVAVRTS